MTLCRREENLLPSGVYQLLTRMFNTEACDEGGSDLGAMRELLHKLKVSDTDMIKYKSMIDGIMMAMV